LVDRLLASGRLPDPLLRLGIKAGVAARLMSQTALAGLRRDRAERFLDRYGRGAIAIDTDAANAQHYEVPPEFFRLALGPRLKYSCCHWPKGINSLAGAEESMLALSCERAGLRDGMSLLDLGCGWGSLTLWALERYPACRVTAVSNSQPQRESILRDAAARGFSDRLQVVTTDVNTLDLGRRFDRVMSIEMFEHVRNHEALFERVADHLNPDGELFVHVFAHRRHAYAFESGWMARRFFTGGVMPSEDLLPRVAGPLRLAERWRVEGSHYAKTSAAWLANLDCRHDEATAALGAEGSAELAESRVNDWRVFFMACEELFAFRRGREWGVAHYRFGHR